VFEVIPAATQKKLDAALDEFLKLIKRANVILDNVDKNGLSVSVKK
jgi:hypothetical protein